MSHSDTLQDWLVSNRLYEDNLFYYALIILVWFFIGFCFLGFEINGYSQTQNLFFNFVFYLFICAMMALCPFWFKLFFGKTHTAKREQELQQALDDLDEYDRAEVEAELLHTGGLAMRPVQRWALVFLGSYFLFEVFFISAWVKDLALVWEPKWASMLIEWVRANTNLPPLNVDRKLFLLKIHSSSDELLRTMYATETEFLDSDFGKSSLLFHFIRALNFPLIFISTYLIFSKIIGWSGANKFKMHYQKIRFFDNIKNFLWLSFLMFFLLIMLFGGVGKLLIDIETTATMLLNISSWVDNFFFNIGHLFFVITLFIANAFFKTGLALVISITNLIKHLLSTN